MLSDRERQILQTLPELPDDLADAFESMKLAVLHHRYDNWRAVSLADLQESISVLLLLAAGEEDEVIRTARRAGEKINAHDFKRIAGALGLVASESTTIDSMVEKILELRAG